MKNSLFSKFALLALSGMGVLSTSSVGLAAERVPPSTALAAVVTRVAPEVPPLAKQLKLSGVVEMDVTIDEEGSVESVSVLRGNPILARSAENTVKKWKFRPIKQGDKAIKAVATFNFDYKQ
jgi:TonB family protein